VVGQRHLPLYRRLSPWRIGTILLQELQGLYRIRFVIQNLVVTQLKIRYHRSAMGFFWTLLNPMLMLLIQAVVFSNILDQPFAVYVVYLFSGLIPWQFFGTSLDAGSRSLLANEYLIRKIAAPKIIFPLAEVLVAGVNLGFSIVALFIIFLFVGAQVRPQLVLLPPAILLLGMFSFGLALIAMTLTTFFRDFLHIIGIFLQGYYFLCPILWYPERFEKHVEFNFAIRLNPMFHLLDLFHKALWVDPNNPYGWPDFQCWLWAVLSSVGALALGYLIYKMREHEYIFRL